MRLRLDLHVHTAHSPDSHTSIDRVIKRCEEIGLNGFAVTDHDTIAGISEAQKKGDNIVVIPGVEISAKGAHILAYDISEPIPSNLSISDTVDRIHEQDAVAVIAHPYSLFRTWIKKRELEDVGFNAIEVANAAQFPYRWMLEKNINLAEKLGLPQIGGSDAHNPLFVGRAHTIVETDSHEIRDILQAIKKGDTEAVGRGITISERLKNLINY